MTEAAVKLTEDRVPFEGIEDAIDELVEVYGGEMTAARERERDFHLPLRRGVASSGSVACTISWTPAVDREATVRLSGNRDLDGPKLQRILLLVAGVVGAVLFMLWPFFPGQREYGTLAWLGGVVAIAVYLMSLR